MYAQGKWEPWLTSLVSVAQQPVSFWVMVVTRLSGQQWFSPILSVDVTQRWLALPLAPKSESGLKRGQSECLVPLALWFIYKWVQWPSLISVTQARMWVIFHQVLKMNHFCLLDLCYSSKSRQTGSQSVDTQGEWSQEHIYKKCFKPNVRTRSKTKSN